MCEKLMGIGDGHYIYTQYTCNTHLIAALPRLVLCEDDIPGFKLETAHHCLCFRKRCENNFNFSLVAVYIRVHVNL